MDPAKRNCSMSFKTPLRELGLYLEGEDSETESLHNNTTETPLLESEEFGNKNLQNIPNGSPLVDSGESAYMRNGNFKTPLHELGITVERLNYDTSNMQIGASRPNLVPLYNPLVLPYTVMDRYRLSGGAPQPRPCPLPFQDMAIPGQSKTARMQTDASQPNIIIPRETANLQMNASQPNLVIKRESEIVEETSAPDVDQPNIIIPRESETANLQIDASQPNLVIKRESEIVEETSAPDVDQPNIIIPRESEIVAETSAPDVDQPNIIIPREAATAIGASQPNLIIQRESEIVEETSAPHVEYRKGKSILEPPVFVDPVDITPEQSKGVLKLIITEGTEDEFPGYGDKVVIHYDGYLLVNGEKVLFESDRHKECSEFIIGRGEVIKGWDLAVSTMKKGEAAFFIVDSSYGYSSRGCPPIVPPNTPLLFHIDLLDWKPEDLSPKKDCSILRRVLEKGEGSTFPNEGSKVKIHLLGRYKGEVFEENEKEFILGEGCCACIPEGIEIALFKFHLKEKSLIYLKDKYGLVSEIAEHGIPPRSPVSYEVTLLSFEKVKDIWEMNSDEKYEKAKVSKERGIEFTKANNFKVAVKHFKWIVTCLEKEPGVDPKTVESRNSLLLSGYLNITLCFLKLENYKDAIKFCDKALKMQPRNEKALFRRGQAKMWNNDSEEAIQDFTTVSELYPENKAAKHYILSCREQIKKQKSKDKSVYNKMFDKFNKQDKARMKNMKTETGVWQNENGEVAEHHYLSETERLIEQNNSLLRDANILELSSNVSGKF